LPSATARVLVVDDDPSIRDVVGDFLELLGCSVRTAANGKEALERVHAERLDLVLLDYMMPVMNGKSFGLEVRKQPRHAGLPIVLMSAALDTDEVCEAIGARACLKKPFDMDELAEIVHAIAGQ
jgi:CheY-like chemotaxis protein